MQLLQSQYTRGLQYPNQSGQKMTGSGLPPGFHAEDIAGEIVEWCPAGMIFRSNADSVVFAELAIYGQFGPSVWRAESEGWRARRGADTDTGEYVLFCHGFIKPTSILGNHFGDSYGPTVSSRDSEGACTRV